ncbi:MAG: SIR2 family protein, partial [Hydrogenophaga sp.]
MQVLTFRNGGAWREVKDPQEDGNGRTIPDPALAEINRNLSDCFRCTNLVVLTGLGTSLHVNAQPKAPGESGPRAAQAGKRIAPTMADLWMECRANCGERFDKVIALTHFPTAKGENIEALLSHCKIAEEFLGDGEEKTQVTEFIAIAEQTVRDCVRFLDVEDEVGLHADFLRRLVRRSTRKLRTKVFTTNYDLCFEYAARKG